MGPMIGAQSVISNQTNLLAESILRFRAITTQAAATKTILIKMNAWKAINPYEGASSSMMDFLSI